jgi:methyl-accepting chemotaxis protein/ligand-binding sensor domain-containing protein
MVGPATAPPESDRMEFPHRLPTAGALLIVLMLLPGSAVAQKQRFLHLGPNDGLASSWVREIHQDQRGFLWFGTANGLTRYDGYGFTMYRHQRNNRDRLPDNQINVIFEDRAGLLWVGTRQGLSLYDPGRDRFRTYLGLDDVESASTRHVSALLEDRRGTFWVGTREGILHFDRERGRAVEFTLPGLESPQIQVLVEDSEGRVWIGTSSSGLLAYDPADGTKRAYTYDPSDPGTIPDNEIGSIVEQPAGTLWIATASGGLARLDPRSGRAVRYQHDPRNPNSLARNRIQRMIADRDRGLWIGLENSGLTHFDPETESFRHQASDRNDPSGLNSNSIWSLYQDAAGTLWVGTFSGGVNVSRPNSEAIRHYRSIPGDSQSLSFNSVVGFAEDSSGQIWVATDGGGVNRFDPQTGRFSVLDAANSSLTSDAILAVVADRDGILWLATWGSGLVRLDPRTGDLSAYTPTNSDLPDLNLFAVHEDRAGRLWIGSWQQGLLHFDRDRGTFTRFAIAADGGEESQIWLIHELHDGRLALATLDNGVTIFDPGTAARVSYTSDPRDDSTLSANQVSALLEIEPGVLLIGTADGLDVLHLREERLERFVSAEVLPSSTIAGLTRDGRGNLWISTDHGIARLDPRTGDVKSYAVGDGLQGSEFNPRAYLRTREGLKLFGGNNGFNVIDPDRIRENATPPPVELTGFQLFNRPVEIGGDGSPLRLHIGMTDHIVLSYDQSVFTFEFAALDFTSPEKVKYAYRMDGFDVEWNQVGTQRTASYTNLPPGDYGFRVIASNGDGVWNEEGASIRITITPPFWQTWWFRALVLLVVIGTVHAIVRRARIRREALRRQKEYLESSVGEILAGMEKLSGGDLTVRLPVRAKDEIGRLSRGFNEVVADIRTMVQQVSEALLVTVAATQQIHASTEEMAAGSQEQMNQALEVAAAAEQMSATVADTARHMAGAAEMARRSGEEAKQGGEVARETIEGMNAIADVVERSARAVEALGSSSQRIGQITRVIDDIAEQTNLLALNATIEAAHAGEHGRGFAVVAEEVRSLAQRTAQATQEITRMIEQIQDETGQAVDTIQQVTGQVDTGKLLVDRAGSALGAIIANSEEVLNSVRQVAAASEEHAVTTTQISRNIERVSEVNQSATVSHEAIARAAENLTQLVEDLQLRVARFRLGESQRENAVGEAPARESDARSLVAV